ncbi:MAG: lytic transglycosylase domain-containing protein [Betaproteobacteria bacterium]
MLLFHILWLLIVVGALGFASPLRAQERSFPVPDGLEGAVNFWKQIFAQYSTNEVVLFDPLDPVTIYRVVRASDNEEGRALLDRERARVIAEYDLGADETRIRSQRGAKEHFAEGLKIAGRYISEMKKIFRAEGLPVELAYLPLVESSFNIRARSGAGAVGMWQFMPDTGKKFLRIDGNIDERRDPFESTKAAARLLKENYQLLGNWPLAITAYNHGTDGMFRGIKAVESDDIVDLIRQYRSPTFGFASKNFYAEFLAVVELATNKDTYFPFLRTHSPVSLREVATKRAMPLRSVFTPAAISPSDFFEWNPALDSAATMLPAGYKIKLPPDKVDDFLTAERRVVTLSPKPRTRSLNKNSARPKRVIAAARKNSQPTKVSVSRGSRAPVKLAAQ